MKKDKKIPRVRGRNGMEFHNLDRASVRSCKGIEDLDDLPARETLRGPLWRGPNDFGDNTSIGGGSPKQKQMERMLKANIGKLYDKFYSKMCELFKGNDRVDLDRFMYWSFTPTGFGGSPLTSKYSVKNGIIVKNTR